MYDPCNLQIANQKLTGIEAHGIVSLDGAMPLALELDTAGLFARQPDLWLEAAGALYKNNISFTKQYPTKILTVGFPNNASNAFEATLAQFHQNLTAFLAATTSKYDIEDSWQKDNPDSAPLSSLLNHTYEFITGKEQGKLVRQRFYADYMASHDGRLPHVNPSALERWEFGDNTPGTIEEAVANKTKFMTWFNEKVLPRGTKSCSEYLFVYVPRTPAPKYRDTYWPGPSRPYPFSTGRISVMSGVPDIVVPIGEVAYYSKITNHTEVLPITVDFMAAKGCDGMLFSLVKDLYEAGLLQASRTGRSLVTGGEILL